MSPYEYECTCKGFAAKNENLAALIRVPAYYSYVATHAHSNKRPKRIEDFWPLGNDAKRREREAYSLTKEDIEDIFKRHNINPK